MKKRGFGKGLWNGFGGKVEDETIEENIVRELGEEIEIIPKIFEKVGVIKFRFEGDKRDWNQDAHVYLITKWSGEPTESEAMLPKWFKRGEIPYEKMWDADKIWMPMVLDGKKINATIYFGKDNKSSRQEIVEVEDL